MIDKFRFTFDGWVTAEDADEALSILINNMIDVVKIKKIEVYDKDGIVASELHKVI